MVKGFKKDGKFRPTEKNNSLVKKKDIKIPCMTLSVSSGKANELIRRKQELEKTTLQEIGLDELRYYKGWGEYNPEEEALRKKGNEIILNMVDDYKEKYGNEKNVTLHQPNIYNEYSTIQRSLALSEKNIEQLLKWKNDNNPKTWKWEVPLLLETKDGTTVAFDGHNLGWEGDAYKGKMAITLMSPENFLKLASDKTLTEGRNDIRGEEHTEKTVDQLTKRMMEGKPVDTPYLMINEDKGNRIFSHEGQHRALSAMKAGIKLMPVYVYARDKLSNEELKMITDNPMTSLRPDISR